MQLHSEVLGTRTSHEFRRTHFGPKKGLKDKEVSASQMAGKGFQHKQRGNKEGNQGEFNRSQIRKGLWQLCSKDNGMLSKGFN